MNLEKVTFAFFIVFALTVNFGFVWGEVDVPAHHSVYELYAALVVSLIATISLVADLQLIAAAVVWAVAEHVTGTGTTPTVMAHVVSIAGGALLANLMSVILLVIETVTVRR